MTKQEESEEQEEESEEQEEDEEPIEEGIEQRFIEEEPVIELASSGRLSAPVLEASETPQVDIEEVAEATPSKTSDQGVNYVASSQQGESSYQFSQYEQDQRQEEVTRQEERRFNPVRFEESTSVQPIQNPFARDAGRMATNMNALPENTQEFARKQEDYETQIEEKLPFQRGRRKREIF